MNDESRKFLRAYFGADLTGVYVCDSTNWQPRPAASAVLDPRAGWYWCPARLSKLEKGQRLVANAVSVHALVIDDVGTAGHSKVDKAEFEWLAGTALTSIETSKDNHQAGFKVDLSPEDWKALRARVPWKVDGKDCVHWFRLPGGVNQKRGNFPVRNVSWGSGDLSWLPPEPWAGALGSPGSSAKPPQPAPSLKAVTDLLDRLDRR